MKKKTHRIKKKQKRIEIIAHLFIGLYLILAIIYLRINFGQKLKPVHLFIIS